MISTTSGGGGSKHEDVDEEDSVMVGFVGKDVTSNRIDLLASSSASIASSLTSSGKLISQTFESNDSSLSEQDTKLPEVSVDSEELVIAEVFRMSIVVNC